jgi:hypothetical protein
MKCGYRCVAFSLLAILLALSYAWDAGAAEVEAFVAAKDMAATI